LPSSLSLLLLASELSLLLLLLALSVSELLASCEGVSDDAGPVRLGLPPLPPPSL
jgi:hypothetical protein